MHNEAKWQDRWKTRFLAAYLAAKRTSLEFSAVYAARSPSFATVTDAITNVVWTPDRPRYHSSDCQWILKTFDPGSRLVGGLLSRRNRASGGQFPLLLHRLPGSITIFLEVDWQLTYAHRPRTTRVAKSCRAVLQIISYRSAISFRLSSNLVLSILPCIDSETLIAIIAEGTFCEFQRRYTYYQSNRVDFLKNWLHTKRQKLHRSTLVHLWAV